MSSNNQKNWCLKEINIYLLLNLLSEKIYTIKNFSKKEVLDRVLHILFHAQYSPQKWFIKIFPYITYEKLQKLVVKGIEAKLAIEKVQLKSCLEIFHLE